NKLRNSAAHPYVAIASGAKISTKVGMLRDLLSKVDTLCLGGVIANVFLAAQGHYPQHHFSADDMAAAQNLLEHAGDKLLLPIDLVVGTNDGRETAIVPVDAIPENVECLGDIGPQTVASYLAAAAKAQTIMWNGPMGKFEVDGFSQATMTLAEELAKLSAFRVVGGGDTMNAIEQKHLTSKFNHVSVGGGAMIEFLEGQRMPGLEPLYGNQVM
ncbi:MAG: phosphoglycerate kinase, partial [Candidatus Andersenbacteria bacterium]